MSRRANLLQRNALYTNEPDGLAADLARYRAVTPASIAAAIKRWLDPARMVEIADRADDAGMTTLERYLDPCLNLRQ